MTISSQVRTAGPFTGNGVATGGPFTFKVFSAVEPTTLNPSLVGVETSTSGVDRTLVYGVDFSVTLNPDQNAAPGGTINYLIAGVGPSLIPTGYVLNFTSNLFNLQGVALTNNGGFFPKVINDALDRLTILVQQLVRGVNASIKFPLSDSTALTTTLPNAATRANKLMSFDASGNVSASSAASLNLLTAFYQDASGNVSINRPGSVTAGLKLDVNGVLGVADGSATAPSYTFASDTNTGFYKLASDNIGVALGGLLGGSFESVASAVNYLGHLNAATGNGPLLISRGSDTNIAMFLSSKGSGAVNIYTNGTSQLQVQIPHVASAVNWLTLQGSATTVSAIIAAAGSDGNIGISINPKGTGVVSIGASGAANLRIAGGQSIIDANGFNLLNFTSQASATDYLRIGNTNAGGAQLVALGSTNTPMHFFTAGTAVFDFQNAAGAKTFQITTVVSAVNYLNLQGAATGSYCQIAAIGSDTNTGLNFISQGTGDLNFFGGGGITSLQLKITPVNTAVNYWAFSGAASGSVQVSALGSDAAIGFQFNAKGNTGIDFYINSTRQFRVANNASAVNYVQVVGSPTTGAPTIGALGSDTNVDMRYFTQGTGTHIFYTATNVSPQFSIRSTASAIDYVNVAGGDNVSSNPAITVHGSTANCGLTLASRGTASLDFMTNGNGAGIFATAVRQMQIRHTASAVNYLVVQGGATGAPGTVQLYADGTDTNINLLLAAKGTGVVRFNNAGSFAANAAVATTMTSLGPTGSHTTIQKWLVIQDTTGTNLYIPCY